MLQLDNVTLKFGGLIAVNQVSFEIETGQIYGLIGPNGAGKTTCFNIISGVYTPTSGKVIFNGVEIQHKKPHEINYMGIARTYQNINLFKKISALENVKVGCHSITKSNLLDSICCSKRKKTEEKDIMERSMELLDFVHLMDKADATAGSLPYGAQRRLEIARAMASRPQLLLLDEPAAGMNLSEKDELAQLIRKIRDRGITILLVEHHMRLVMDICDEICVLNYGKKICEGIPTVVQNDKSVIEAYLGGAK